MVLRLPPLYIKYDKEAVIILMIGCSFVEKTKTIAITMRFTSPTTTIHNVPQPPPTIATTPYIYCFYIHHHYKRAPTSETIMSKNNNNHHREEQQLLPLKNTIIQNNHTYHHKCQKQQHSLSPQTVITRSYKNSINDQSNS